MAACCAFFLGALSTLSFAPFNIWLLALLCPAGLMGLWVQMDSAPRESTTTTVRAKARRGASLGFAYGLGSFAAGTWWLYISIRIFGQAPLWVALIVMSALVLVMASYYAALGYAVLRWMPLGSALGLCLLVPCAWLLVEWLRGWFLSGFPWMSLGYSQTDTWLSGFAPLIGVYGLSGCLLVMAGTSIWVLSKGRRAWGVTLAIMLLPWLLGLALRHVEWNRSRGTPITVAILQGAIPQDMKWQLSNQQNILDTYQRLHRQALGHQLILWPESALPDLVNNLPEYVGAAWGEADAKGSSLVLGVMRLDDDLVNYYNSVLALGVGGTPTFYDKQHLVPFGEYFPVPSWVREWLRLLSLPYSDFTAGRAEPAPLEVGGMKIAASICYEDAYPALMHRSGRQADFMVNVTNDAWFGRSPARFQHLQISRMRAMEARRYLLRAANDGVTAIIDPKGGVVNRAPEFEPSILSGSVVARSGATPYQRLGDAPVLGFAALALIMAAWRRKLRPAAKV